MPTLKRRMIFISHAWDYNEDYWTIVNWFNNANNFRWSNCSVPSHDRLPDKTTAGLKRAITRQINPAQVVVIIAGMYAAHSDWIDYEIDEAVRLNKTIIGIRPRSQQRVPTKITDNATKMVNWNSSSLITTVREYT